MAMDSRTKGRTLLPTQAFVTRQYLSSGQPVGNEKQTDEVLEIHEYATAPANVRVEMGMTINLGNYESARISVSLSVPCYTEEKDEAYDYAKKWVEERTLKEAEDARSFARGRGSSNPF